MDQQTVKPDEHGPGSPKTPEPAAPTSGDAAPDGANGSPPVPQRKVARAYPPGRLTTVADGLVLGLYLLPLLVNVVGIMAAVLGLVFGLLFHSSKAVLVSLGYVAVVALLDLIPLKPIPRWVHAVNARYFLAFKRWLNLEIVYEAPEAFQPGRAYLLAYEPHSVMPLAMGLFTRDGGMLPAGITSTRVMGSTAMLWAAISRNFMYALGLRSVSRSTIEKLLVRGISPILNPGGVQEVMLQQRGSADDHVYLSKRTGFVRLALKHNAPIVPIFGLGESKTMSLLRLTDPPFMLPKKWGSRMARTLRFAPALAWGYFGTPVPKRVPVTIVVGAPLEMPKVPKGQEPSAELVGQQLDRFISELKTLFEKHKAAAGYPDSKLIVH